MNLGAGFCVALKCVEGGKGEIEGLAAVRCKGSKVRSLLDAMKRSVLGLTCTAKC